MEHYIQMLQELLLKVLPSVAAPAEVAQVSQPSLADNVVGAIVIAGIVAWLGYNVVFCWKRSSRKYREYQETQR